MPAPSIPSRKFGYTEKVLAVVLTIAVVAFAVFVGMVHKGFEALSGVRAYVEGEAHWSKAQKDAVYHLLRYALLDDEASYQRFHQELDVIHGDRQARLELESPEPDMERVRDGFLRGRIHPDDVDRVADFFLRYRDVPYVERAVAAWEEGDEAIFELEAVAEEIRRAREAGAGREDLAPLLDEVDALNRELTVLEARFSRALGEGARWGQRMLSFLVLITAGGLVLVTWLLARALTVRLRQAEASLRASEERYRELYENAPLGIYRVDRDGRIVEANPALLDMLGVSDGRELLGEDVGARLPRDSDEPWGAREEEEGTAWGDEVIRRWEVEWKRPDGRPLVVTLTGRAVRSEGGRPDGYELFAEDVTERVALDAQLRETQKMEAVGQMTGGVAQDFNNLLTVVFSSAGRVRREVKAQRPEKALAYLDLLEKAASRGERIAAKLLAFSQRSPLALQEVDLRVLTREARPRLNVVLPTSVEVRMRLDEDCPPVKGDPQALEQILFNLVGNAGDAMPDGGSLEIAVEVREGVAGPGRNLAFGTGSERGVVLRVRDTGVGMSNEVLERAFEPFFTTKGSESGTGLGLAMVHGLVHQHGGGVRMRSEVGEGTEVEVVLVPAEDEDEDLRPEGSGETDRTSDDGGHLLSH